MIRSKMTLEKAVKLLEREYERAKRITFIRNPLAYALYQVWKVCNKEDNFNDSQGDY